MMKRDERLEFLKTTHSLCRLERKGARELGKDREFQHTALPFCCHFCSAAMLAAFSVKRVSGSIHTLARKKIKVAVQGEGGNTIQHTRKGFKGVTKCNKAAIFPP